jgi:hypothetical protein
MGELWEAEERRAEEAARKATPVKLGPFIWARLRNDYITQVPVEGDPFRFEDLQLRAGDEILLDYEQARRWHGRGLIDVGEIVLPCPLPPEEAKP